MRPSIPTSTALVCLAGLVSLSSAVVDGYYGQYADDCPSLCNESGPSPANWTQIHHLKGLRSCNRTVIFDLNVQSSVDDPQNILTIRACVSTGDESYNTASEVLPEEHDKPDSSLVISNSCGAKTLKTSVTPQVGGSVAHQGSGARPNADDISSAARQLANFMRQGSQCGTTILFAKSASAVVGMYSGAQVAKSAASRFLDTFKDQAQKGNMAFQVCNVADAALTFGVYAASLADLGVAQEAVKSWTNSLCLNGSTPIAAMDMGVLVSTVDTNATSVFSSNATSRARPYSLKPRGSCKTEEVYNGDSCASLASRCGISGSDITKYNTQPNFCATLKPKQHICCGPGDLPDFRPQPDADGTCNTYKVGAGDGCFDIADAHYLQQEDIENFNKKTWGWAGCAHLQTGQYICLSKGNPPMPVQVQGTTCGPQVPGTKKPTDGTALADLNPCPLNACCDAWGFCGTTADFCTATPADTGAPGTAKPGTNGCISNCGMELVNNGRAPDSFKKLGYFEAFNGGRACLHMGAYDIPSDVYSHIHFAFATVTTGFDVDISAVKTQFDKFTQLSGFKKVLSFGGWAFSTDQGTFQRFRDATKPEYRGVFVNNLVNFLNTHNIDGLDFDWEYPGAPDIPDITPGSADEGKNYLDFLSLLRSRMPGDKTISIAIPASYWYLKQYPVKNIANYVDYFIYMTYDLHGQWDVDSKWAIPSCDGGNCLRSHVNKTETLNSLVMLTKAGVESRKIVVGVSSYGRSFRMKDESCSGPFCQFTGGKGDSHAYPGRCTATGGYISNAELNEIIQNPGKYSIVKSYVDDVSNSNILMYGNPGAVDWVAYMDGKLKSDRIDWIKNLNFAGFSDWAIDLESFTGSDSDGDGGGDEDSPDDLGNLSCTSDMNPGDLEGLADKVGKLTNRCMSLFTLDTLYNQLLDSLSLFATNSKDYDDKFGYYADWVKENINGRLSDYMKLGDGKGNQFFKCYWNWYGRDYSGPCAGMPHIWEQEGSYTIRYELVDEEGFYDAISTDLGIDKSWVKFGNLDSDYECADAGSDVPMRPGGTGARPCRKLFHKKQNFPMKGDDKNIHVGNPKALIEAAWSNITALQDSLLATYAAVGFEVYGQGGNESASELDPVVAYAMPVLQLAEAIDSMKDIKDIGAKAKAEHKKNLILKILTIVFMVIPFVGEALGPLIGSAAAIARIALLVGELGNAAVTVADIVEDPTSAPFAILGLIAGVGGGSGRLSKTEALEDASKARGLMKEGDLAKFPQRFRDRDALIQKIVKKSCPK